MMGSAATKVVQKSPTTNTVEFLVWFEEVLCKGSATNSSYSELRSLRQTGRLANLVEQNLFNEYAKNPKFAEVRDNANGRTNTILVGSCYQPGLSAEELPAFPRKEENRKRVHFSNQSQSKETHDTKAGIVADEEVHLQDNGNFQRLYTHRTDVRYGDMHTNMIRMGQSTERVKEGRVATNGVKYRCIKNSKVKEPVQCKGVSRNPIFDQGSGEDKNPWLEVNGIRNQVNSLHVQVNQKDQKPSLSAIPENAKTTKTEEKEHNDDERETHKPFVGLNSIDKGD
ncbi:hypothetical protein JCM33374_g3688 [Metschnikowia sp. JCM 33374]|nr:hypothetical protein JCM33374_g3688 [Metschnikowia sp. JCM 33374]